MTRFLARRLLNYVLLLILASFLTFALTSFSFKPLDSLESRNPRPPQEVIEAKRAELNLDKPIPMRYAQWASGAVHGDFGTTITGQPISAELGRRVGVSLRLPVVGAVLGPPSGGQPATPRRRCGTRDGDRCGRRRLGSDSPVSPQRPCHHDCVVDVV